TFTDSTPSPDTDYTATVSWGDGTTSAGTVTLVSGTYSVTGTHTYAEDGQLPITVVIQETTGDLDTATASGTAVIAEGFFTVTPGGPIITTEGQAVNGFPVADFFDASTPDPASDFTATIDWGDGTTELGTITAFADHFTVTGSHTYADGGAFTTLRTV